MSNARDAPFGLVFLEWLVSKCCAAVRRIERVTWHQAGVLVLTYIAYTCYHMTRKPISVVKNVLTQNCSAITPPADIPINDTTWCDWAPFDKPNAPALLGTLDSAFLFSYAAAMFVSGFIAERANLRYFLAFGMIGCGIFTYLLGIAKTYEIHNLWYFIIVQIFSGIFQTSGWPGVVTVLGNWFGKSKRGLIFGIWNSHTSLGNILGSLIAAQYVETDWALSFIVPGVAMGFAGLLICFFLAAHPNEVGCMPASPSGYRRLDATHSSDEGSGGEDLETGRRQDRQITYRNIGRQQNATALDLERTETTPMLSVNNQRSSNSVEGAIGFWGAIGIPGVVEYSLSLFFAKLVSYTFLFWLPLYIAHSTNYGPETSADLSTLFDVGGIIGAIIAGYLSDCSGMSALTCAVMLGLACPTLFIYDYIGSINLTVNMLMLVLAGLLVNGPYALITTAVSAELGTHPSLGENSKALATVTAIIDGTGSIGAAVGPMLAGFVSNRGDPKNAWHNVYYMLMTSEVLALVLLSKLVYKELKHYAQRRRAF